MDLPEDPALGLQSSSNSARTGSAPPPEEAAGLPWRELCVSSAISSRYKMAPLLSRNQRFPASRPRRRRSRADDNSPQPKIQTRFRAVIPGNPLTFSLEPAALLRLVRGRGNLRF